MPFTGDEPLYTQEVDCVAAPAIAAHARHTLLLQPGESIADCFVGEAGSPEQLLFEVSGEAWGVCRERPQQGVCERPQQRVHKGVQEAARTPAAGGWEGGAGSGQHTCSSV